MYFNIKTITINKIRIFKILALHQIMNLSFLKIQIYYLILIKNCLINKVKNPTKTNFINININAAIKNKIFWII